MKVQYLIFLIMFFKLNYARYTGHRQLVKSGAPDAAGLNRLINVLKCNLVDDDDDSFSVSDESEEMPVVNVWPKRKLEAVFDTILDQDNIEIANEDTSGGFGDNEPSIDELKKLAVSMHGNHTAHPSYPTDIINAKVCQFLYLLLFHAKSTEPIWMKFGTQIEESLDKNIGYF